MNRRALLKSLGLLPIAKALPAGGEASTAPSAGVASLAPYSMGWATATATASSGGSTYIYAYDIFGMQWHAVYEGAVQ